MEYTIKRLKRNKSLGPDKIPNEIFIEANKETKKIYQEIMNTVYKEEVIPERWQEGEIKRLYTGKGQKGKCSNERGITLASNVGKVFERIINRRVKKEVYITEAQGGGIHGNATVDHLVALKEAANQILKRGKTAYMIFLDVQKAYDKAWLDAILYALYRNGVEKKSRNNQKTEHGTHSTNTNQIWAHKKNNDKRQYTTRRSAISHRICNPDGRNNQRDQQKWHGTRTKKWWKT